MIAIALNPGENHIRHIDKLMESITHHLTIDYHLCVLAPREIDNRWPNATVRVVEDKHMKLFEDVHIAEKRSDIPVFHYTQLMVPQYFPEYDKILFLEVDQWVQKDLAPLWRWVHEEDIKLAAVCKQKGEKNPESFTRARPGKKYFNTGVVVVDTRHWIDNKLLEKCFDECKKQKASGGTYYTNYAQGAMNMALDFTEMPIGYNFTGLGWRKDLKKKDIEKATILHWNGRRKPWCEDGLYKEYYDNH